MTQDVIHEEEVISVDSSGHVVWSSLTQVYVERGSDYVILCQDDDVVVLPPEYIPGIIKALEKALEK